MFRRLFATVGVVLAGFHVWLLAGQAWDGQLADLALLARWTVAGGLVWGLVGLWRQGESLVWGRRGIAVWLLAALLHGPAVAERVGTDAGPAMPEVVATLAQIAVGATGIIGLVLLLGALAAAPRPRPQSFSLASADHAPLGALSPDAFLLLSPRPPPVA